MPVAVVTGLTERHDLKTLEGGFVVVREMSYGERIMRQSMSGKLKLMADKKSEYAGEMEMATAKLTYWDFANLVVEHNCEDADGRTLNFKNFQDVDKLGPRIGEEIGSYIDKLNSFEDIEEGN